jgi:transposase-like protein
MNKDSIRKKIEDAKLRTNEALSTKGVAPEMKAAVESLLLVIDILAMIFLEKKVRKTSSNSGVPPSQNFGSNGNRNKNINNANDSKGNQLPNTRNIEIEEIVPVNNCKNCGSNLQQKKATATESRVEIDIIYEITKKTVTTEIKKCNECGEVTKGKFPKGMDGKLQYGAGIRSAIINYLMVQMMSLEKVEEHFKGFLGRVISQATMLKYVYQFYLSLEKWEAKQMKELLKMPVIHVDETSLRVNKINHWLHVYTYGDISLQFVHPERGKNAVNDIGIIPKYGGIIVHDCWATYFSYDNVKNALCGSHILRELKYIEECDGFSWAMMMKELLKEAGEVVASREITQTLTAKELDKLQLRYREILKYALTELPHFPKVEERIVDKNGKKRRGRLKHTDAQNLYLRLKKYEEGVLMFTKIKEVNFTNNRAERDIRCSKVKQKVSGGFRTFKFAKAYARITSFAKTMRYRGYSSFQAINIAMVDGFLK